MAWKTCWRHRALCYARSELSDAFDGSNCAQHAARPLVHEKPTIVYKKVRLFVLFINGYVNSCVIISWSLLLFIRFIKIASCTPLLSGMSYIYCLEILYSGCLDIGIVLCGCSNDLTWFFFFLIRNDLTWLNTCYVDATVI